MCKKQGDLKGAAESGGRDSSSEATSRNLKELAIWKNGEQYSGRGNSKCKDCGENEPEVFKEWKVMGAAEQRAGVGRGDGDEGRAWGRVAGRAKAHTALQARDKEFFWVGWEILEFRQKSTLFDPCVEELTLAAVWRGWGGSRQAEEEAGVLLRDGRELPTGVTVEVGEGDGSGGQVGK